MKTFLLKSGRSGTMEFHHRWTVGASFAALVALHLGGAASAQMHVGLELVGQWNSSGPNVTSVSVADNYAYLSVGTTLQILDVSNPAGLLLVGTYSNIVGQAYTAQPVGKLVFLSVYGGDTSSQGGLEIIDVSNPEAPQQVSRILPGNTYELQVIPPHVYLADFYRGLEVYDVRDPANPVLVTRTPSSGNAMGIRVLNNYAFLAAYFGGLQLVDVSDPEHPVPLGKVGTGETRDVDVNDAGTHAFLADTYNGLNVASVDDPSNPKLVSNLRLKGYPNHVRVLANHAFVSANQAPLQVVNVSDPLHPILVGSFPTAGGARMIEVAGSTAYLISNDGRLVLLGITEHPIGFSLQPEGLQIQTGQTARFSALAVSPEPMVYQWQKGGIDLLDDGRITGTRTSTLTIGNATHSDQACYSVVASNSLGRVESLDACLTVVPGLREALDDPALSWTTSSFRPWHAQTAISHDGADAAECGPLQAGVIGVSSSLNTQVEGPGTLSYWWRLEDSLCFELNFFVGSTQRASLEPWLFTSTDWQRQLIRIPSGTQDLRWTFSTLCGDGSPAGRAWLDEVSYVRGEASFALAMRIADETSVVVQVTGTPGVRLSLQVSSNLISWNPAGTPEMFLEDGTATQYLPRRQTPTFYRAVEVP